MRGPGLLTYRDDDILAQWVKPCKWVSNGMFLVFWDGIGDHRFELRPAVAADDMPQSGLLAHLFLFA